MLHRLLEQSEEKQATSLRTAAIESESELVEIVVEMVGIDGTMVDAQPPAIKQSGHAMHSWHDDVGRVATGGKEPMSDIQTLGPWLDLGWWS